MNLSIVMNEVETGPSSVRIIGTVFLSEFSHFVSVSSFLARCLSSCNGFLGGLAFLAFFSDHRVDRSEQLLIAYI